MNNLLAVLLLAGATSYKIATPALAPLQQSVLTRTRSQAALKLAPSASLKLKNISNALVNGPALNDYADVTRRGVVAAFPGVHLTDGELNSLSAIAIADAVDSMKKQLDSMNEMGQMESLRLQMAMDRMSKMMTTLSNILKKMNDTSQSITQNLK